MTNPVYKIETYTGAVLDHTITADADHVMYKESVTDSIGYFSFTVPSQKGGNNSYSDIALNDKIKIWIDYDSVSGDPHFIGYVYKINSYYTREHGFFRVVSGLGYGEILLRRFKNDVYWIGQTVKTVADELADDLSLGKGDIPADATVLTTEVETKTYFDVLRGVSDYWVSAGTQIKKDFMVDVDFDLRFVNRGDSPFVSYAALTLEPDKNVLRYEVIQDKHPVRNNISVYGNDGYAQAHIPGSEGRTEPDDKDRWTENDDTGWTYTHGTNNWLAVSKKVGDWYLAMTSANVAGTHTVDISRTVDVVARGVRGYKTLNFFSGVSAGLLSFDVELENSTAANEYTYAITQNPVWVTNNLDLGENQEYDALHNPNGVWTVANTPNWYDIDTIRFTATNAIAFTVYFDGLHFSHGRYRHTASDATSQTSYGRADLELTDDKLHSDSECEKRSETLLYQLKDPPTQINVVATGDSSIKAGDKRLMTFDVEGISATYFYVLNTEHVFSSEPRGYVTKASLIGSINIRDPAANTNQKVLSDLNRRLRELSIRENWVK